MTMNIYPGGRYLIASRVRKPAQATEIAQPAPKKTRRDKKQEE